MKRYIAFLTLPLILIGVAWGGCIFDKAWYQLKEGDCISDALPEDIQLESVDTVSCSDGYEWRVVSTFEVPRQDSYPGEDFYAKAAFDQCDPLHTDYIFPLEEDWGQGSQIRKVICLQDSFGLSVKDPARLDRLVALNSLAINDCFKEVPQTDYLLVEKVSCTSQWDYIVRHRFEVRDMATYPGLDYLDRLAVRECPEPWDYYLYPSPESWQVGDRLVMCISF